MRTESFASDGREIERVMRRRVADLVTGLAFRFVARALFRVRVAGHVPAGGPALLVSNHLTYLDAFLIGSCVRCPVRFLVWKPYYDNPALILGFRLAGSIPISEDAGVAAEAIRRARAGLATGEIVCIFPEGSISRTGRLLEFKRGLEAIARDLEFPIVPIFLSGLWESVFSFKGGRLFGKRPRHLRHPVEILFGMPLAASSTAREVRRAVERLGGSAPSGQVG